MCRTNIVLKGKQEKADTLVWLGLKCFNLMNTVNEVKDVRIHFII